MKRVQPTISGRSRNRRALTTVELLVSTMLASMLMLALLGVLRGLRVQAEAMEAVHPTPVWKNTLDHVLQFDLENSRRYQFDGKSLLLTGFAGREPTSKSTNWKPTTVSYEIVSDGIVSWLLRREKRDGVVGIAAAEQRELVLSGVDGIRLSVDVGPDQISSDDPAANIQQGVSLPIREGLTIECWRNRKESEEQNEGGLVYACRFRKL